MNILVTGGLGYIGSNVCVALSQADHEVVVLDNLSNSDISVISQLEIFLKKKLPFIQGDIQNKNLIVEVLKQNRIDAVIHLAGAKAVSESTKNPMKYYDNNVVGTVSLLLAMMECKVYKIVFSSSATVYGEPHYLPYDELHPTNPVNPYGRTKLQVEKIIQDLVFSDVRWRSIILRYFNPVGAHESGLFGENPSGLPNNLMPLITQVAVGKLPYLKVFGADYPTKDGTGERDYIHVTDLAEGHLSALNYLNKYEGCHVFNLGTGTSTSVLGLINSFEKITAKKIPYQITSRRPGDLAVFYASSEKATNQLGWAPRKSIEDMCLSAFMWQNTGNV